MSAPGNVTSYAPKGREPGDASTPERPPTPTAAPSEPAIISSTIDRAVGRIGDIAAAEMEAVADDIMEAATHVSEEFRRLAEAMRLTSANHGKAAAEFCARMRTSYESVRTLSGSFDPRNNGDGEQAEPPIEPQEVPKFLKRQQ